MFLKCCTISGIDEATPIEPLLALAAEFPFVEYGILISPNRTFCVTPQHRYPNAEWISKLPKNLPLSLHLCGHYARTLLWSGDTVELEDKFNINQFGRVQINAAPHWVAANKTALARALSRLPQTIFQIGDGNSAAGLSALFAARDCCCTEPQPLFDASGGRGQSPLRWPWPATQVCGYAGGLGPYNLSAELTKIEAVAGNATVWIDMESNVRTNDVLDLGKVRLVLEIIKHRYKL